MAHSSRIDELTAKYMQNPRRFFASLANEYRKAGELDRAIGLLREHLPSQPGHMSGYIVLGQAYFDKGDLGAAREVFGTAVQLDDENLVALRHLGEIAKAQGDLDGARAWYARVLDSDPHNEEVSGILRSLAAIAPPETGPAYTPTGVPTVAAPLPQAAPPLDATPPGLRAITDAPSSSPAFEPDVPAPADRGSGDRPFWLDTPVDLPTIESSQPAPVSPPFSESPFATPAGLPAWMDEVPGHPADDHAAAAAPAPLDAGEPDQAQPASDEPMADATVEALHGFEYDSLDSFVEAPVVPTAPAPEVVEEPTRFPWSPEPTAASPTPASEPAVVPPAEPAPEPALPPAEPLFVDLRAPSARTPLDVPTVPADPGAAHPVPGLGVLASLAAWRSARAGTPAASPVVPPVPEEPAVPAEPAVPEPPAVPAPTTSFVTPFSVPALEAAAAAHPDVELDAAPAESLATEETFATETMARLYMEQGFLQAALDIYRQLAEREPSSVEYSARIHDIETSLAVGQSVEVPAHAASEVEPEVDVGKSFADNDLSAFFDPLEEERASLAEAVVGGAVDSAPADDAPAHESTADAEGDVGADLAWFDLDAPAADLPVSGVEASSVAAEMAPTDTTGAAAIDERAVVESAEPAVLDDWFSDAPAAPLAAPVVDPIHVKESLFGVPVAALEAPGVLPVVDPAVEATREVVGPAVTLESIFPQSVATATEEAAGELLSALAANLVGRLPKDAPTLPVPDLLDMPTSTPAGRPGTSTPAPPLLSFDRFFSGNGPAPRPREDTPAAAAPLWPVTPPPASLSPSFGGVPVVPPAPVSPVPISVATPVPVDPAPVDAPAAPATPAAAAAAPPAAAAPEPTPAPAPAPPTEDSRPMSDFHKWLEGLS